MKMENNSEFINFYLPDYMSIPKGFKIILESGFCDKSDKTQKDSLYVFPEKSYTNDNGNIIEKIDDINFDNPFFGGFSEKEKQEFLKHTTEILDFNFYCSYFEFDIVDLSDSLKEKYNKIKDYLSNHNPPIYISISSYNFTKNDNLVNECLYAPILRNQTYTDINPKILKYLDIPKGAKLTLKLQYSSDNHDDYVDVLPWKKTYSNPTGNKILMKHHDVDVNFENPIFRGFSDIDKCHFYYYYMTMLDEYLFYEYYNNDPLIPNNIYFFNTYLEKYLLEDFINFNLISDITYNGLDCDNLFKRKERPDICYSCSKRKSNAKNKECIYIGFA